MESGYPVDWLKGPLQIDEKLHMRAGNLSVYRALALGLLALFLVSGCGSVPTRTDTARPVFFPPPPEKPRLQFLKSFSGPADLGAPRPSGFERFVLGEAEQREGIATPYGLALFNDRIYICDVGRRRIEILDLQERSFGYMTEDRRLMNPVNLCIEPDGTKYVADPSAGAVFVFDASDTLQAILGKDLQISPIDVAVRGAHCYVTDYRSNQVVVLDKATGKEIRRMGEAAQKETAPMGGVASEGSDRQFKMISDLTFGPEGGLYVTDRLAGRIFQFDESGTLTRTLGSLGDNIDELARPKGVAVDRAGRVWVVDSMPEVAKIYDREGQLLLFFGLPGNEPGMMNLPTKIILDYDHVDLFRPYAVKGANIEFLVLVSNQYGPNKVSVYGFGEFPKQAAPRVVAQAPAVAPPSERVPETPPAAPAVDPAVEAAQRQKEIQKVAEIYRRSMTQYRAGELAQARAGFVEVLDSQLIPPQMEPTLRGYIQEIDAALQRRPDVPPQDAPQTPPVAPPADPAAEAAQVQQQIREVAELYRQSMALYNAGDLERARAGFIKALESRLLPPQMEEKLRGTIGEIDAKLGGRPGQSP